MGDFDLISDVHLDYLYDQDKAWKMIEGMHNKQNSKTLVIAGDFSEAANLSLMWVTGIQELYENVLYVPGNHEYYNSGPKEAMYDTLSYALGADWTLLMNERIGDFKGTTLWYAEDPMSRIYERKMADIHYIPSLTPWVYEEHAKAVEFLISEPQTPVWITHHLPFWNSVHPKYTGSQLNRFFVGDLAPHLHKCQNLPKVIVHGHTHEEMDYYFNGIHIVCNPIGYENEGRTKIIPKLVRY